MYCQYQVILNSFQWGKNGSNMIQKFDLDRNCAPGKYCNSNCTVKTMKSSLPFNFANRQLYASSEAWQGPVNFLLSNRDPELHAATRS